MEPQHDDVVNRRKAEILFEFTGKVNRCDMKHLCQFIQSNFPAVIVIQHSPKLSELMRNRIVILSKGYIAFDFQQNSGDMMGNHGNIHLRVFIEFRQQQHPIIVDKAFVSKIDRVIQRNLKLPNQGINDLSVHLKPGDTPMQFFRTVFHYMG